jgi:hypothetical protein
MAKAKVPARKANATNSAAKTKPNAPGKKAQKEANVTLTIGQLPFKGKSSGQYGHAEMAALRKYIVGHNTIQDAVNNFNKTTKRTVSCHAQDVCVSCSIVLKKLGFREADSRTKFSDRKSGGVSWGASIKVRDFLAQLGCAAHESPHFQMIP